MQLSTLKQTKTHKIDNTQDWEILQLKLVRNKIPGSFVFKLQLHLIHIKTRSFRVEVNICFGWESFGLSIYEGGISL